MSVFQNIVIEAQYETIARMQYEAYKEAKFGPGLAKPWENIGEQERQAWIASVKAILVIQPSGLWLANRVNPC